MIDKLFLCVGAQKSGTTWLHAQLESHPKIHFSDVKEVHYFNTLHRGSILLSRRKVDHLENLLKNNRNALERYFTERSQGKFGDQGIRNLLEPVDDQWYERLFYPKSGGYAADFSPEYALLPESGWAHIRKISQQRRILFVMRDPLKRALSALQYHLRGRDDVNVELVRQTARQGFILNLSKYEYTLDSLMRNFPESERMFLFFEEMMESKADTLKLVESFLEISHRPIAGQDADKKVNASKSVEVPDDVVEFFSAELEPTYRYVRNRFGRLPQGWKDDRDGQKQMDERNLAADRLS